MWGKRREYQQEETSNANNLPAVRQYLAYSWTSKEAQYGLNRVIKGIEK